MRRLMFGILLAAAAFVAAGCFRELDPGAFDVVIGDDVADVDADDGDDDADAPETADVPEETESAEADADADVTPAE
jgi:hypothetical protein